MRADLAVRDSGGARPWGGLFELPDGYWATMYRGHTSLHNYRESEPAIEREPGVLMLARWLPHRFCGIEAEVEGTIHHSERQTSQQRAPSQLPVPKRRLYRL